MNFKEAFSWVEANEKVLSPILKARKEIEEFKQKLIDPALNNKHLLAIRDMLVDTGTLDSLSQALEYLPEGGLTILDFDKKTKTALLTYRYGPTKDPMSLTIEADCGLSEIGIRIGRFCCSENVANFELYPEPDYYISLNSKEWKDHDRVTATIADAVWKTGGKTPKTFI